MDEYDLKILNILKENARTPVSEIAKRVGLSRQTVKSRIDKLEKDGVIKKYTIELPEDFQNEILLLVEEENVNKLLEIENVAEVLRVSSNKFFLRVTAESLEEVRDFVRNIKILESYVVFEKWKKDENVISKVKFRCDYCGKKLVDKPLVYKYRNRIYLLCCKTCLDEFKNLI